MKAFLHDLRFIAIGGLGVPVIEYFKKYNLLDFSRDGIVALARHKISDNVGLVVTLALYAVVIYLLARY